MRLWHKDLLLILPRQQLVAQWRELSAIAGAIKQKGTPNHMLVNFVLDYPFEHFISYAYFVRKEMTRRGYRTMDKVWDKIKSIDVSYTTPMSIEKVYKNKMDNFYYQVCLWNLIEKVQCGGITEEPYRSKIIDEFNNTENNFQIR